VALQQADQFNQQNMRQTLSDLEAKSSSSVQLYKQLNNKIEGVSDPMRQEFQSELKKEITKEAQDVYNEPDPQKAFAKATGDANFGTLIGEVWRKLPGYYGNLDVALNQAAQSSDANALDRFVRVLHPEATPEGRAAFIKTLTDIKDPNSRAQTIGKLWADLEPQKQASVDINGLVGAADNVSNPEYQRQQTQAIAVKKAWIEKKLQDDPRLKGTLGEFIADQGAQLLPNVTMALLPPGIRESAFAAQIYSQAKDEFRSDHPDWTEAQLNDAAGKSALLQLAPQEVVSLAIGGKLGALTGAIENRAARIGATALSHVGIGAGGTVLQQVGANIAAGKPIGEGIGPAALAGAIQTLPGGIAAGLEHPGLVRPGERPAVTEERPPVEPQMQPVAARDVLGPEVSGTPVPWYKGGPIVSRGIEPEAFTPSQLAEAARTLPEGGTPEELRQAAENLRPPTDFTRREVFLDSSQAQQAEIDKAQVAQAPQPTPEQQAKVDRVNVVRGATGGAQVGSEEPWVSKIANRFTAERMATGELGPVEPGLGVTKEEMLARGLKMGPEQIAQHVSNVMNNVGGNPRDQAAAIRTEEARLSQRSHDLSLVSEANPQNTQARIDADNAFKDLSDFHNGPVAKLKNDWHAQGMSLQGEIPADLSTYNGLREQFLKDVGKPPPASAEPVMRKTAKRVRDATMAETAAMKNLGTEIERQSARRKLPSDEEVRQRIMERTQDLPCPT
jgi:hypothetical protein